MPSLEEIDKAKESGSTREERQKTFQERFQERQERKVNLAKERNTSVMSTL